MCAKIDSCMMLSILFSFVWFSLLLFFCFHRVLFLAAARAFFGVYGSADVSGSKSG